LPAGVDFPYPGLMPSQSKLPRVLRFGTFEIDVPAGELRKNGIKLKLQDQPFQLLCMLVERPGEVVTREDLRTRLWPADTFVDFDHGLNAAVKRLRDALGDSAEAPRFVETMARRGYRFISSLEKLDDSGHFTERVSRSSDTVPTTRSLHSSDSGPVSRRTGLAIGLGVVIVAATAFWLGSQLKAPRVKDSVHLTNGGLSSHNSLQVGIAYDEDPAPAAFRVFWSGFISAEQTPLVIFSNAKFVGSPEVGLRYYDEKKDGKDILIFDHYTGVGETLAVHELDRVFAVLHREIRLKRGSLLELDDAKNNNLIFVGSPLENLTLLEIPGTQEFVFHRIESGPRKGDPELVNVHPQPGEPKEFLVTPRHDVMTEDYAVVALLRGLNPAQSVLILAGNTTMGTQAAVEYVCHLNSVEALLPRLSVSENGQLKPFEAVIRVKVTRGVPVSTELVALRSGSS
jgi:DNA-binding winged helix-turn-helix (wHTH) protein